MNNKKRATTSDVARAAGLSVGTVSSVINGRKVSDANYLKVKKAMDKLGYVVNENAQALRKDKTSTIALIIPNINSPYFSELVQHINEFSSQKGLNTIIACSDYDINEEGKMINMAKDKRVAGIIALTYNPWLTEKEESDVKTDESENMSEVTESQSKESEELLEENLQDKKDKLAKTGTNNLSVLVLFVTLLSAFTLKNN